MNSIAVAVDGIAAALQKVGIGSSGVVLVHSGVRRLSFYLKRLGVAKEDLRSQACQTLIDALRLVIGEHGTICIPAFHYGYARFGETFIRETTPPDELLGIFPGYFFSQGFDARSLCPPVSICAVGPRAKDVCDTGFAHGYGVLSPWKRLEDLNAKMLFWDCTLHKMTYVHHLETIVAVPHLYAKIYDAPVMLGSDRYPGMVINSVRYRDERFRITYDLARFQAEMLDGGLSRKFTIADADVQVCTFRGVGEFLTAKLGANPYYLLKEAPHFIPGLVPFDGGTGARQNLEGGK